MKAVSVVSNVMLNTWGIFFYFFCQWVMTVVVVRLAGFEVAGVFSLAVAFSNIFAFIGLFGVRGYQICDVREKYSNGAYVASRLVSTTVSLVPFILVLLLRDDDSETTLVCLAYMLFKSLEGFSDVFWGGMQRENRYDWLAVSCTLKGAVSLAVFAALLFFGMSLPVALLGMSIAYIPMLIFYDGAKLRKGGAFHLSFTNLKPLFVTCFPLMLNSMLLAIIIYLPREAIGRILGEESVGYYGALAMVIVVSSTIASAVWGVVSPAMSRIVASREAVALRRLMFTVGVGVLGGSVVALLLGDLIGGWIFSLVFGKTILPYMYLLTPILINSILLICVTFFDGLFIALEGYKLLLFCNFFGTAFCWLSVSPLTSAYGIYGANLSMMGGLALRLAVLGALSFWLMRKRLGTPVCQPTIAKAP